MLTTTALSACALHLNPILHPPKTPNLTPIEFTTMIRWWCGVDIVWCQNIVRGLAWRCRGISHVWPSRTLTTEIDNEAIEEMLVKRRDSRRSSTGTVCLELKISRFASISFSLVAWCIRIQTKWTNTIQTANFRRGRLQKFHTELLRQSYFRSCPHCPGRNKHVST